MTNICQHCLQSYCCKLKDKERIECPIFGDNPPQEQPEYEQPQLPWDATEGMNH